jgi:hypothetical protein
MLFSSSYSLLFPLSLSAGTLLLLYASQLHRRSMRSRGTPDELNTVALLEATCALVLVGVSLFWGATNYAAAVGESRAREFERSFRQTYPSAILYSKDRLHLTGAGVEERVCAAPEAAFKFRYDGLRLMLRSGDQYVFLPDAWSPSNRVAIILPEGDSLRLQFSRSPYRARSQASIDHTAPDC